MRIMRYQPGTELGILQGLDSTAKKPVARVTAFIPRDTRRSVWDLITKHNRSVREVQLRTGLSERQILDVLMQRISDEIEAAVIRDRVERGPQPPTPMIARRAA